MKTVKKNDHSHPEPLTCTGSMDTQELRFSRVMAFAIDEINNSSDLLPGSKIQQVAEVIRSSTATVVVAFTSPGDMRVLLEELTIHPSPPRQCIGSEAWVAASHVLSEFWEGAFNCLLEKERTGPADKVWDGTEDIRKLQNPYTDTSQLRITNMVYKAVYAIAHTIHNIVCKKINSAILCDQFMKIKPVQVLDQLKRKFNIKREISWADGGIQVPVSVCSDSCPPGTRKVLQEGKPFCCYDCVPCAEGEISNSTDSSDCSPCPNELWSNAEKNFCDPKLVEFLSFNEIWGIILAAFSIAGACLTIITAIVLFNHRFTPVVRANNSELSFLLLFSLTLCFLCSLTFIGRPSDWSCMLRHTAFGISFVLSISCVLGKTIVVLMAFKATIPGSNVAKCFGLTQQRMTVVSFTFVQVLICIIWLVQKPPFSIRNLTTYNEIIILECALGSAFGFWAVLGYIGLLAVFCFVLAVLARKLPDNFNEAKLITFSMLIFCAVWITFIPAYISSPGKFTVAVEVFAILASSYGLIICIFFPKCFIILFRPEKNTKKHLMGKK
ncbi:unnamed protein product [Boreogadus saida]